MIKTQTVKLTKDETTGFTDVAEFDELGSSGMILNVIVREDATNDDGTAAVVYLADAAVAADLASAPADEHSFYESAVITLAGSAKVASSIDPQSNAPYVVKPGRKLRCVANVTATTGGGGASTDLYVTVRADVDS